MGLIRNLLAAVGCLTVVVVLAVAGWMYRGEVRDWWAGFTGDEIVATEPSPELAARAEAKLEAVAGIELGDAPGEGEDAEAVLTLDPDEPVRLSELELQSLLRYRLATDLPEGVQNPAVAVGDSTLELSVDLDLERLAVASGAAENLRRLIGDSTRVVAELRPGVVEPGVGEVEVVRLQAGAVPVPSMFIPNILSQAGFPTTGGTRVQFAIPREVVGVRIEAGEVVLVRDATGEGEGER